MIEWIKNIGCLLLIGAGVASCVSSCIADKHDYWYGEATYHISCSNGLELDCHNIAPGERGNTFTQTDWTTLRCYPGDGTVRRLHTEGCSW